MRNLTLKFLASALFATVMALKPNLALADRYSQKPPVVMSPELSGAWVMQLQGRGAGIVAMKAAKRAQLEEKKRQLASAPKKTKSGIDPRFLPTTVDYSMQYAPGTVVVDTGSKHLYLVLEGGKARRYGVGVGKAGFEWSGTEKISRKAKWPSWRPPAEMIKREKQKGRILPTFMEGGADNPLGARALYLGSTLYRIHGTNQPWTIGKALSSGCIRMRNQDVTALYEQVKLGAKVVVL